MKKPFGIWSILLLALLASLACGMPSLALVEPTATPRPSRTARATFTPTPTETPAPTFTPTRTPTPIPPTATATNTPLPTATPTDTPPPPPPTNTPRPRPTNTPAPPPPPPPTATPSTEFSGAEVDIRGSYNCGVNPFIAVQVVDRGNNPMKDFYVHIGTDGSWGDWMKPTTASFKQVGGFQYNADYLRGANKYYITVFRQPVEPFNIHAAVSNEVTVRIDDLDEEACNQSEGKNTGGRIRVAAVRFVYNR